MFTLTDDYTYTWPVTIHVPADGGTTTPHEIKCTFKVLPDDELKELLAKNLEDEDGDLIKRVWIDWDLVNGSNKKPLEFNDENLARMVAVPYVRAAVTAAYFKSVAGAKIKNSPKPPRRGR